MKRKKKDLKTSKEILVENIKAHNNIIPFDELSNIEYKKIPTDSWFIIKKSKINKYINFEKQNDNLNNDKIIKCKKITILPTDNQQKILLN